MLLDEVKETANITPRTLVNIAAELSDLKKVRFEIIERLLDTLNNDMEIETDILECLAAKEELATVNNRVRELEYILRHAEWILPGNGEDALKRKV